MKENIIIASIAFTVIGTITIILNNIEYKEIMDKLDDFDKRLKKIEIKY
jgi:hypothetical protein